MAKIDNRPQEKMQLIIEFADNGIILRNPDLEDEVTLALTGHADGIHYEKDVVHDEEYKAIGRKVYEWLTEVTAAEHSGYWIATGAELDIVATLTGRKRE
jgi:hypothetical protein